MESKINIFNNFIFPALQVGKLKHENRTFLNWLDNFSEKIDFTPDFMLKNMSISGIGGFIMFAIIETGGKQYRVSEGDVLKIEKISDSGSVTFDKVLMVSDGEKISVGNPFLASAKVTADIVGNGKSEKVLVFKMRPRKNYRKIRGHRQLYTAVKIKGIQAQ
jgi:large subunit ribosomal protein L21